MKVYSLYDLKVVKVGSKDNVRYLICKYNKFTDTYIEILTNEKLKISDECCVEALSNCCLSLKSLMLDKKELLQIYITINGGANFEQDEEPKEIITSQATDEVLEKATMAFFPKNGVWYSHCFRRPCELEFGNLPCHLRDDVWLAKMLKKDQNLFYISNRRILNFVRTSQFFKEKRHEYELEIVKCQIIHMGSGGEGWICDDNYGGDLCLLTSVCDLGFRKGVVDTLSKIGMKKDVIEEGLEKFAYLWREELMNRAFRNEYEPVFFLSDLQVEPTEEEHKEKWLKMRRYEYYQNHKEKVDLYGTVSPDMLMTKEEAEEIKKYLSQKHQERELYIEAVKKEARGTAKTLRKDN